MLLQLVAIVAHLFVHATAVSLSDFSIVSVHNEELASFESNLLPVLVTDFNGDAYADYFVESTFAKNLLGGSRIGLQRLFDPLPLAVDTTQDDASSDQNSVESVHDPFKASLAATGDVNGDDALDLVLLSPTLLYVLINAGGGDRFVRSTVASLDPSDLVHSIALGYVNDDRRLDIVVVSRRRIQRFLQTPEGTFDMESAELTMECVSGVMRDLDGDGSAEIVIVSAEGNVIVLGAESGRAREEWEALQVGDGNETREWRVVLGDANGDGRDDLCVLGGGSPVVYIARPLNHESSRWHEPISAVTTLDGSPALCALGSLADMDNDGLADLLCASPLGALRLFLTVTPDPLETKSFSFVERSQAHTLSGLHDRVLGVFPVDFDNDGNMDVIVGSSGREGPLVLHGDGQEPSGEALMRNHVRVRLRGGGALGSRVTVHQWDPLLGDHAMGSVLASVSYPGYGISVGIGTRTSVCVEVLWSGSRVREYFVGVWHNSQVEWTEGEGRKTVVGWAEAEQVEGKEEEESKAEEEKDEWETVGGGDAQQQTESSRVKETARSRSKMEDMQARTQERESTRPPHVPARWEDDDDDESVDDGDRGSGDVEDDEDVSVFGGSTLDSDSSAFAGLAAPRRRHSDADL